MQRQIAGAAAKPAAKIHWVVVALTGCLVVALGTLGVLIRHRQSKHESVALSEEQSRDPSTEWIRMYPIPRENEAAPALEASPAASNTRDTSAAAAAPNVTGPDPVLYPGGVPNLNLPPQEAAKYEVNRNLKQLEGSGAAASSLNANALKVVEDWKQMTAKAGADFADFHCFKDGCSVVSTHGDMSSAMSAAQHVLDSSQFFGWPGGKFRSGPIETSSGKVQFTWILYSNNQNKTEKEGTL
jgi:hypothetical protein